MLSRSCFAAGLLALGLLPSGFAQTEAPDWSVLMQTPGIHPDEVKALHDAWWAGRTRPQGGGWKQVERWLHSAEGRTDADGAAWGARESLDAAADVAAFRSARSTAGNWTVCGPTLDVLTDRDDIRGVGRMNAIAFHPTDANTVFAGAPSGGLWRSYDGGASWTTNTDHFPSLGVSSICFDPFDPTVVYIGTGDRDAADSPGLGVMKSTDGGLTWAFATEGLGNRVVGDLLAHPTEPGVLLAATSGGVFRSTDAAASWELVSANTQNYKDIAWHPTDPAIVYATGQGRFWRSGDGGLTWTYINEGIDPSTRMVISVTPAAPDNVYVCSTGTYDFRAFFRSTDGGLNFTEMSDSPNIMAWSASGDQEGGQAWYDLCLVADPVVADRVYVGGIRMKRSDDGGATWVDMQDSFLHVDHHALAANPHTEEVWLANDGGIYRLAGGVQWADMSAGIVTGQIYKIGQSPFAGTDAMNGYQDNGTYAFDGAEWSRRTGGDGFDSAYDVTDPAWFITSSQNGRLYRTGPGIQNQGIVAPNELGITEEGAWSTPFALDRHDQSTLFVGLVNVWRSRNIKTAVRDSIVWEQLTTDLGASPLALHTLHRSKADTNVVFVAKASRRLYRSVNALAPLADVQWDDLSDNLPLSSQPVTALETVPGEDSLVYLGFNNKVWRSDDLGLSWTDISGTLPDVRVNSLCFDSDGAGLYAGTDRGIYFRADSMGDWVDFSQGLPLTVRVTEIELYPGTSPSDPPRLRAGTYGRGMWESDRYGDFTVLPPVAWIGTADGETAVYGTFTAEVRFRRNLEDVQVMDFAVEDVAVTNGTVNVLTQIGTAAFAVEVQPTAFGPVTLSVPEGAAVLLEDGSTPNAPSDSLVLVYREVPGPLGPFGPGGVGDEASLALWLRADAGVTGAPVSAWTDVRSGNGAAAVQSEMGRRPTWEAEGLGGRPAIRFDGEDDALVAAAVPLDRAISAFAVAAGEAVEWDEHGWIASARGDNGYILHPWKASSMYQSVVIDTAGHYAEATPFWIVDAGLPQFYGLIYDQTDWDQAMYTVINDQRIPFPDPGLGARIDDHPVDIRFGWDFDDRYGTGRIAEEIVYTRRLMESHRTIVSNYTAARYGLPLGSLQRYFRPGQPEEVAGIGRISAFDLHTDARGTGNVRILASSDLGDGEFLLWGHDGAGMEAAQPYPFLTPRVARTYGYEATGEPGTVELRIDDAGAFADLGPSPSVPGVIVAEGEDFLPGSAPAFYPLAWSGSYWTANVEFAGSGVFTFGMQPALSVSESIAESGLQLYPNPADDRVTVRWTHADPTGAVVRLRDAAGRTVVELPFDGRVEVTLDLSGLAPGCYLVEAAKATGAVRSRLVIR